MRRASLLSLRLASLGTFYVAAASAPKMKKRQGGCRRAISREVVEILAAVSGALSTGRKSGPPGAGSHRDLYLTQSSMYVTVATSLSNGGSDHGADRPEFAHRHRPPF